MSAIIDILECPHTPSRLLQRRTTLSARFYRFSAALPVVFAGADAFIARVERDVFVGSDLPAIIKIACGAAKATETKL